MVTSSPLNSISYNQSAYVGTGTAKKKSINAQHSLTC